MKGIRRRMTRLMVSRPRASVSGAKGPPRKTCATVSRTLAVKLGRSEPESMRIADYRIHSIAIADPPLRSSYGLHAPFALRTILELESEDGIVGISETHGGQANARVFEGLRPRIVGADAYRLCGVLTPLLDGLEPVAGVRRSDGVPGDRSQTRRVPGENPVDAGARAYSAIEMASLDLIGRSVGKPVCDLLGGRVRDEMPFSAYLFYKHAGGGGAGEPDEYGECLTPDAMVR